MPSITKDDEFLHEAGDRKDWRESYYFNWVDAESEVSGFSTIGLLPNQQKRELVFVLFYDDKREVYFIEPDGEVVQDLDGIGDSVLSYELVDPLKKWVLSYNRSDISVELSWEGRFSCYDFGEGSGTSWEGHFEQSGRVNGYINLPDGRELNFEGYGERDKSWGYRNWHIDAWYAFHAQFKDFSIGLRRDFVDGEFYPSGAISNKDGHVPIEKVELETEYLKDKKEIPFGAVTIVHGSDGSIYEIESCTLSQSSFIRFERDFNKGRTELFENMALHRNTETNEEGTGLLEWLFTHPK
ncbi:MAG: hypothetical protein KGY80_00095 [Candidatus Thorarchaeota archaeon]|nr:hypothetical protein [Candidatus Thorarchaeota archaeon]